MYDFSNVNKVNYLHVIKMQIFNPQVYEELTVVEVVKVLKAEQKPLNYSLLAVLVATMVAYDLAFNVSVTVKVNVEHLI